MAALVSAAKRRKQRRTALVVARRAAVDRCGAGYAVPPLVPQGGHRERRPAGAEDWHKHRAEYFELSSDDGRPTARTRPEQRPQGR